MFMALFGLGCVLAVIESDHLRPEDGWTWHTHMDTLISKIGGYSIATAAAAMVATEVLEVFVLLADALREIIQEKRHKRFERIRQEERERLFGSGVPTFCPIWGTPAKVVPTARAAAVFVIDSQRAGGKYEISRQLLTEFVTGSLRLAEQDRDAVTQWLSDQRAAGVDLPVLTVEVMRNLIRPDCGSENSHTE